MPWNEKWKIVEEYAGGGQGKVYRVVNNLERIGYTNEIVTAIRNLSAGTSKQNHNAKTDSLFENLPLLINLSNIDNQFALKELHDKSRSRDYNLSTMRMGREIHAMQVLTKLDHPNLIKLVDHDDSQYWFVTHWYSKGSVEHNRHLFTGKPLKVLVSILELLEGLKLLHEEKFIHRDIKPENIFVGSDNRLTLGDFGLVLPIAEDRTRQSVDYDNVGSRDWQPTWTYGMRSDRVNATFDIFSVGKVLWSMISGKHILQLWYFNRDDNNLEKLFPKNPAMKHINKLLSHIVVEHESDCLDTVDLLIEEISETIHRIQNLVTIYEPGVARLCPVCQDAPFELLSNDNPSKTVNFGISPGGSRHHLIFQCPSCGYVEVFHYSGKQPKLWWSSNTAPPK